MSEINKTTTEKKSTSVKEVLSQLDEIAKLSIELNDSLNDKNAKSKIDSIKKSLQAIIITIPTASNSRPKKSLTPSADQLRFEKERADRRKTKSH